jgi:uncharacterized protein
MTGILSPREIRDLTRRIVTATRPEQVILFGSYAKGRATVHSDLDILVVVPDHMAGQYHPTALSPYVSGSVIRVDLHIVTASELAVHGAERYHFLHSIRMSGKVLYDASEVGGKAGAQA